MSKKIEKALQGIASYSPWSKIPHKDLEAWILEGNTDSLKALKPTSATYILTDLAECLPAEASEWEEVHARIIRAILMFEAHESFTNSLKTLLAKEKKNGSTVELFQKWVPELTRAALLKILSSCIWAVAETLPNSFAKLLVEASDSEIESLIKSIGTQWISTNIAIIFTKLNPDRFLKFALPLLLERHVGHSCAEVMAKANFKLYEILLVQAVKEQKDPFSRFRIAQTMHEHDPKYLTSAIECGQKLFQTKCDGDFGAVANFLLTHDHPETLPVLKKWFEGSNAREYQQTHTLEAIIATAKERVIPFAEAVLKKGERFTGYHDRALKVLIPIDKDQIAKSHVIKRLEQGLAREFGTNEYFAANTHARIISMAAKFDFPHFEPKLWDLLEDKSKGSREAAARALGALGDRALDRIETLLKHKKADVRRGAVLIAVSAGTPYSLRLLEARVDEESDDNVRDEMLKGLEQAWEARGRKITFEDVQARIERGTSKAEKFLPKWIDFENLPSLYWASNGKELTGIEKRYLLYRQSRSKELQADIEAKAAYGMIDKKRSGDFALEVLKGYVNSKVDAADRWALVIAGILGDDRVVPVLNSRIRDWADSNRGKLAENAVRALALRGSDAALLSVDAFAIRYRTKNKNIGAAATEAFAEAAEAQGITPDELGDRVVPWLGFEPGKKRLIDCGGKQVQVRIGTDFKLQLFDVEKNKKIASMPKSASSEVQAEFKEQAATLKEVVKAQLLRLENMMVRQYRWPVARWKEMFLLNPVLVPFAVRLIWGHYDEKGKRLATFHALEDLSLTDAHDEPIELGDSGGIGIIHPLELDPEELAIWKNHVADYEIDSPFLQLERPTVRVKPEEEKVKIWKELNGTNLNAMTFRGRAERINWARGSVCDGGGVTSYYKSFPRAGVDVFLGVDGMYIGIGMDEEVKLTDVTFVKGGSVKIGTYEYDEPSQENDTRLIPFGEVPVIVFSEAMGDLQKIAGSKATTTEEAE